MRLLQRIGAFGRLAKPAIPQRSITTTRVQRGGDHHDVGGVMGANLPFPIHNRYLLAFLMTCWFGSGFATPFLLLRHQLKKKSDS